jgi:hypothetical protein
MPPKFRVLIGGASTEGPPPTDDKELLADIIKPVIDAIGTSPVRSVILAVQKESTNIEQQTIHTIVWAGDNCSDIEMLGIMTRLLYGQNKRIDQFQVDEPT